MNDKLKSLDRHYAPYNISEDGYITEQEMIDVWNAMDKPQVTSGGVNTRHMKRAKCVDGKVVQGYYTAYYGHEILANISADRTKRDYALFEVDPATIEDIPEQVKREDSEKLFPNCENNVLRTSHMPNPNYCAL